MTLAMEHVLASLRKATAIIKLHLDQAAESMAMNERLRLVVLITAILVLGISRYSWIQWRRRSLQRQQIIQHSCEPATTLSRNPWLFGIDVAREMFSSYDSGSRNEQLTKQFREIGSTFRAGSSTTTGRIFTIDPRNLKAVFGGPVDSWGVAPVRFEAFKPLFGNGVLISDGNVWRHSRTLAEVIIDRIFRAYTADLTALDGKIDQMLDLLPRNSSTVDLQPIFYQFTMDVSTQHIFGDSIGAMRQGDSGEYGKNYLEAFIHCLKMAGERDEVPQWTHFLWDRKFAKSCRMVQEYVTANLDRGVELNVLGDTGKESAAWKLAAQDRTQARNHILNVLAASFDTSAILLTNTFFHLSRNPAAYQKLRHEVLAFEGVPNSNTIKSMVYMQAVLNETLRLHGPASFNSRVALHDNIIPAGGGPQGESPVFVPKGDIVIVCQYALQRNYSVWGEDANIFRPERWRTVKPKHWEFQPFSGGSRVCPGQKLGQLQAAYSLFRIVQRIAAVENRDPVQEFIEEYRVATGSRNGAQVGLVMAN